VVIFIEYFTLGHTNLSRIAGSRVTFPKVRRKGKNENEKIDIRYQSNRKKKHDFTKVTFT
jgi:hypothetical protein